MSYLIDGIRHCDLKGSFFTADYDAKNFFRKSTIESCRQAVESSSIWGQKKNFSNRLKFYENYFKLKKTLFQKSHRP